MALAPRCTRCDAELERGFIPDASYGVVLQTQWHPGEPTDSRFLGLKLPTVLGGSVPAIRHDPTAMLPITAYRCPDCGALSFFAHARDS